MPNLNEKLKQYQRDYYAPKKIKKMSEQTLKFGKNVVNKKDFYASKQAIN